MTPSSPWIDEFGIGEFGTQSPNIEFDPIVVSLTPVGEFAIGEFGTQPLNIGEYARQTHLL